MSEDVAAWLEQSRGLERDHLGELVTSRKRAWQVAMGAGLIAFAAVAAGAGLTPLQPPPEASAVRVDTATGSIEHVSALGEPPDAHAQPLARGRTARAR